MQLHRTHMVAEMSREERAAMPLPNRRHRSGTMAGDVRNTWSLAQQARRTLPNPEFCLACTSARRAALAALRRCPHCQPRPNPAACMILKELPCVHAVKKACICACNSISAIHAWLPYQAVQWQCGQDVRGERRRTLVMQWTSRAIKMPQSLKLHARTQLAVRHRISVLQETPMLVTALLKYQLSQGAQVDTVRQHNAKGTLAWNISIRSG